nr:RNA-directed DNA polymerase, eukaryota [Tanacetum cinerariifolium]
SQVLGVGVPRNIVNQAASLTGCAVMQNPFWYLGVMVGDSMSQKLAWADTVQKLRFRLSKWKVKTLSIEGRLTLLKSVLGASLLYNMSIYRVSKGVLKEMEAIRCNFFIGADPAEERLLGSLGIKSWRPRKIAVLEFQSSIWCSILREMQVLISKGFDFVSHCKKRVGDGHNTRFWYDSWVFDQPLRVRFPRLFALETDKESTWDDLNFVSSSVTLSASKDRWICDLNGDGVFRVKEVRNIFDDIFLPSTADATRWVKYIPIKINVFAWRARLDRLPTRSNLVRRGVVLDSSLCPLCGLVPEDIHHVLFRCDTAKLVFRKIWRRWDLDWHDLLSFLDWNTWFSAIRFPSRIKLILEEVFYVAWWHLWVYRNQSIFAATPPRHSVIFDDIVSRFSLGRLVVLESYRLFGDEEIRSSGLCLFRARYCGVLDLSQELKNVSYHKLYDILKQHHIEVNEIRAEKIARFANPLALVAQQQQTYHPQTHPTHYNQYSSTRTQQAATRKRGKAIVKSPQPIYDQEPSMVDDDDEMSKDKEIDKLMALISLSFKKIYKPTNNNLHTSSNTSRANQDNSLRIHKNAGYEHQRLGNVAGARETVGSKVVQKSGIQCYNCKEHGHVARECQKPKRAKDAASHREKMLLYAVDFGPIFDKEPEQKVQTDDHYDVFANELDMNYDSEQIDQNDEDVDLTKERELPVSLIEKLKCEIDETKNRNTILETSNKVLVKKLKSEIEDFKNKNKSLKEANNKLSKENDLLYANFKKSKAKLKRRDSIEYASEMELAYAKVREMKNKLSAHQDTISILKQQKDTQIKLYKSREDKELEKVIDLENKVKNVSYHKLYDILKQHQHEVNEIRAEKIARVANLLVLVAQQQHVYYPQTHPTHYNQNSSTRTQQAATRNRGKAIVNSPQPIYDQEPSMVDDDDETSKDKEIDKLMALISLSFKKIYKPTNNNLRTSSNTSRANQDNSPRIHQNAGYKSQRSGNVAGARETVGSSMVQKSRIQCYNCKEYGHVARECQKPNRAKDAAYHREKMLLSVDFGPIFDTEPEQKVQNDDHYDVFAIECQHPEQSGSVHKTYLIEKDAHNVLIESEDMNYDSEQIDQNEEDDDLAKELIRLEKES